MKSRLIIDTHCHLTSEIYKKNNITTSEIVEKSKNSGVFELLTIGVSIEDSKISLEKSCKYPEVFCSVGVHPCYIDSVEKDANFIKKSKELSSNENVKAIGECGLDYSYLKNDKKIELQKNVFKKQIELSIDVDKPLIIHCRNEWNDLISILSSYKRKARGIIHCFTGTLEQAKELINLGFYISISGIATFKNAEDLRTTIENLPIEKIILETDSPYLAPEPYRGSINLPENILITAKKVASIKNLPLPQFLIHIRDNVREILKI